MINSPDLMEVLKYKGKVEEIRLSWRFIQTGRKGKYDNDQKAIYIKTESRRANELKSFLNSTTNDQQIKIVSVHLTIIPSGIYPTKQQQSKLQEYTPVQANLISNLREMEAEIDTFKKITRKNEEEKETNIPLVEVPLQVESIVSEQGIKRDILVSKLFHTGMYNTFISLEVLMLTLVVKWCVNDIHDAMPFSPISWLVSFHF